MHTGGRVKEGYSKTSRITIVHIGNEVLQFWKKNVSRMFLFSAKGNINFPLSGVFALSFTCLQIIYFIC